MARFLLLGFIFLADALIFTAASDATTTKPPMSSLMDPLPNLAPQYIGRRGENTKTHQTSSLSSSLLPPATSRPSTTQHSKIADEPQFGKKQQEVHASYHQIALEPSARLETQVGAVSITEDQSQDHDKNATSMDQPAPTDSGRQEIKIAKAPANRRLGKHHSMDKSIAGGGVILGGLATTFIVSIICYIRATRRKGGESSST